MYIIYTHKQAWQTWVYQIVYVCLLRGSELTTLTNEMRWCVSYSLIRNS